MLRHGRTPPTSANARGAEHESNGHRHGEPPAGARGGPPGDPGETAPERAPAAQPAPGPAPDAGPGPGTGRDPPPAAHHGRTVLPLLPRCAAALRQGPAPAPGHVPRAGSDGLLER